MAADDAEAFACVRVHLGDVPRPVAVWSEQLDVSQGSFLTQILLPIQGRDLSCGGFGDEFHDQNPM